MVKTDKKDLFSVLKSNIAGYNTHSLSEMLNANGVVQLHNFLPADLEIAMVKEANKLLHSYGKRINTHIKSTGNTPRKYVSVSRNNVFEHAPLITKFYSNPELLKLLAKLTKGAVIITPYEPEQIVVNEMNEENDTHGWHWDDYSYSFVVVLETPDIKNGAQVEYVDGTLWDKKSDQVNYYLETMTVKSLDLVAGSAYLLLGKRVMHRVSPLKVNDTRKIICFTYATEQEQFSSIEHGSMQDIYG